MIYTKFEHGLPKDLLVSHTQREGRLKTGSME
jgi:hypothetical protein